MDIAQGFPKAFARGSGGSRSVARVRLERFDDRGMISLFAIDRTDRIERIADAEQNRAFDSLANPAKKTVVIHNSLPWNGLMSKQG